MLSNKVAAPTRVVARRISALRRYSESQVNFGKYMFKLMSFDDTHTCVNEYRLALGELKERTTRS